MLDFGAIEDLCFLDHVFIYHKTYGKQQKAGASSSCVTGLQGESGPRRSAWPRLHTIGELRYRWKGWRSYERTRGPLLLVRVEQKIGEKVVLGPQRDEMNNHYVPLRSASDLRTEVRTPSLNVSFPVQAHRDWKKIVNLGWGRTFRYRINTGKPRGVLCNFDQFHSLGLKEALIVLLPRVSKQTSNAFGDAFGDSSFSRLFMFFLSIILLWRVHVRFSHPWRDGYGCMQNVLVLSALYSVPPAFTYGIVQYSFAAHPLYLRISTCTLPDAQSYAYAASHFRGSATGYLVG
ncbi:hypothetical protein BDZ89DRAFT_1055290 [Hymenopellis radicata]|nr:hypothetical protein BDZ89DRAFT_1055290 [Hymenopellis radicata]